jgi:hypothetical protein
MFIPYFKPSHEFSRGYEKRLENFLNNVNFDVMGPELAAFPSWLVKAPGATIELNGVSCERT